jgi:hypothetical protein
MTKFAGLTSEFLYMPEVLHSGVMLQGRKQRVHARLNARTRLAAALHDRRGTFLKFMTMCDHLLASREGVQDLWCRIFASNV